LCTRCTKVLGVLLAVTTHPGTLQDASLPFELKRLSVLDTTGVAGVAALVRYTEPISKVTPCEHRRAKYRQRRLVGIAYARGS
jgi:hypothetical protein